MFRMDAEESLLDILQKLVGCKLIRQTTGGLKESIVFSRESEVGTITMMY